MYWTAFFGEQTDLPSWRERTDRYAQWMGVPLATRKEVLPGTSTFVIAWLNPPQGDWAPRFLAKGSHLEIASTDADCCAKSHCPTSEDYVVAGSVRLLVDNREAGITLVAPMVSPERCFYTRWRQSWVVANDMRLMMRFADDNLDAHGVYSLLRYFTITPPYTIAEGIRRVPNGYSLRLGPSSESAHLEQSFSCPENLEISDVEEATRMFLEEFDRGLRDAPSSSALMFSGGLDSAIIALRLLALGRRDFQLINYSYDGHDADGLAAVETAKYLGLECQQVRYSPCDAESVLDRIARDYSVPFGDHSTLPVNLMVHASLPALVSAGTVFDGSGADAEFQHGIGGAKWKALYALPSWTRRLIGTSYRHARLWKLPPGSRLEAYIGQARISAGVPDLVARAILNGLNGIAYRLPHEVCAAIDDNVVKYLVDTPSRMGHDMQHSVLELKHYCGGLYMPKSFDPLRNHGVRVAFPYTQPGVVHLACTLPSHIKCADNEVKGMLKRVAIESLPHQLVHRRKSGFKSPLAQFLALASTQERLHENVLGSQAPLSDYLYSAEVRKMIDRIGNGKPMAHSAKSFLWTVLFASEWLLAVRSMES